MYDTGLLTPNGKRKLTAKRPPYPHVMDMLVPCGKCPICLERRRNEWCMRMRLELMSHNNIGTFITLTYRPEDCPESVCKSEVQKFVKRLRHAPRDYNVSPPVGRLSYYATSEYGSKYGRPHYHLVVFGFDMLRLDWDPRLVSMDPYPTFASGVLEHIWPFGFNVVGRVTPQSIRYVSKYVSKSLAGPERGPKCGPYSGPERLEPLGAAGPRDYDEFSLKSIGLGRDLFVAPDRDGKRTRPLPLLKQCLDTHCLVLPDGDSYRKFPLPKFLDNYFERFYPDAFESLLRLRREYALADKTQYTSPSERLAYCETQLAREKERNLE